MKGDLLIDKIDVYDSYGAFVVGNGYNGLIGWAAAKTPEMNDWHEEDGIEVDLSCPVLDSQEIEMTFGFSSGAKDIDGFCAMLAAAGRRTFDCLSIGASRQLRLVGILSVTDYGSIGTLTATFADDLPLEGYTYLKPNGHVSNDGGYMLDDLTLGDYGVIATQGTLDEVKRLPDIKTNLVRNISVAWGAEYDTEDEHSWADKTMTIECYMSARSREDFWRNYNALLYDLIKPEARQLTIPNGDVLACRYVSQRVAEFYRESGGGVWARFAIELQVLSQRPSWWALPDNPDGGGNHLRVQGGYLRTRDGYMLRLTN